MRRRLNFVSAEVTSLALEVGWQSVFFTNKLQLQKLLSRRRLKDEEQQEDHVSDSEAEESSIRSSENAADSEEESLSGPIHHPDPHAGAAVDSSSCCDPDPEGDSASTEVLTEDTQSSTQSSSEDSDLGL